MARVKTAVCLLAAIMIWSVSSLFILGSCNRELKSALRDLQTAYETGDIQQAIDLSARLDLCWQDYEKKVTMLIHDDVLSDINISIAKLTPYLLSGSDELPAEIQSLNRQLDRIYSEEFPSWYNIL